MTIDLYLGVKVTRRVAQYSVLYVTYSGTKFDVATSYDLGADPFTKMHYLTFDHHQYPLHHVTYPGTTFKVGTSIGLGGDTFPRNVTDGRTDGRRTDFRTKLIYFFSKGKCWYKTCLNIPPRTYHAINSDSDLFREIQRILMDIPTTYIQSLYLAVP